MRLLLDTHTFLWLVEGSPNLSAAAKAALADPANDLSAHALAVLGLPAHHKDPFDRLLIAQATVEGMTLVTADKQSSRLALRLL